MRDLSLESLPPALLLAGTARSASALYRVGLGSPSPGTCRLGGEGCPGLDREEVWCSEGAVTSLLWGSTGLGLLGGL